MTFLNSSMDGKTSKNIDFVGNRISKVIIDNLTHLTSHAIDHGVNAISHHIVYINDGEVRLSYRIDGSLLEFSLKGVV